MKALWGFSKEEIQSRQLLVLLDEIQFMVLQCVSGKNTIIPAIDLVGVNQIRQTKFIPSILITIYDKSNI